MPEAEFYVKRILFMHFILPELRINGRRLALGNLD